MKKLLTPDAAGRELAKVRADVAGWLLAVVARKREALKELAKERNGEIAKLEARARELMDIANGAPVQAELDTGEEPDDLPGDGLTDGGLEARAGLEAREVAAAADVLTVRGVVVGEKPKRSKRRERQDAPRSRPAGRRSGSTR